MNNSSIEINNLSKQFKNVLAVKNISFKISKGKIIGLLGPNGSGKSTTIGMMLGLIKPTSGTVVINNQNIENNRTNLLEKMNFISPYVELPKKLTVEENLKVYGRMYGVNNLNDKISELMKQLNLSEFKKRKTGELSSGQKKRVSLAKALLNCLAKLLTSTVTTLMCWKLFLIYHLLHNQFLYWVFLLRLLI